MPKPKLTAEEKLKIVVESLDSNNNKSELCRRYGIYPGQLQLWTQRAMFSAQEGLKERAGGKKKTQEDYLFEEIEYWKDIVLELTAENQSFKKKKNGM